MRTPFVRRRRLEDAEELLRLAHAETRTVRETAASREATVRILESRIADLKEAQRELRVASDDRISDLNMALDDMGRRLTDAMTKLAETQAQHHELAMHPPTGILTGPAALSPLAAFGPKTQEAIKAMSAGLGKANRDAMIAKAFEQKGRNVEDEQIAQAIYAGESVKFPTHLRS